MRQLFKYFILFRAKVHFCSLVFYLMLCWCMGKVSASLEAVVLRTLGYSILRLFEECCFLLFEFLRMKSHRDPLVVIGKSHFEYIYSKYMDHSV